jgi:myo-inositol 2-dehydrogenase / D-chiro-inositol 1-dehydrogenase
MKRRNFVATGLGLSLYQPAQAQTREKSRTALIGVGNRGTNLLEGVLQQTESATLTALCDIKPDRLDKAASTAKRDNPRTYTDWRTIVERKDIDTVFIATPPHLHAEMAAAALDSGKHVYCEKPVGINPQQVQAVVDAVRRNPSRTFTAGQQLRSIRQMKTALGRIHAGDIGEILMLKAQRHANADLPYGGSSGDWYYDVTKSGGYLIEQSVHNLDLCNWVMQGPPRRAVGFGAIRLHKNEPAGRTIFDCGSMVFEYPGAVQLSFTQNVFHPRYMPAGGQYVHIFGSKAAVDLMQSFTMYPQTPVGPQGQPIAEKPAAPGEDPHAHIAAFYEAMRDGKANPADIQVGATAALTAILGHWAMTKERLVEWKELGVSL